MSVGTLAAGLAGVCGVLAAWEALAAIERSRVSAQLARLLAPLRRAGLEGRQATSAERRRLALVAAAGLAVAGWLLSGPLVAAGLAIGGPWVARTALRARRRRYRAELRRDAPVVARALADALSGGHSVRGALLSVAAGGGLAGPAARELGAAAGRLDLGEATAAVLERLRARAGLREFDTIVAAILVQDRAGGDLSRLLRGLAAALEEAMRLEGDARAATAQARFTGLLVSVLPLAAAGLAELGSPGYLGSLLAAPLTAWLLGCALAFQVAALGLIARIARVTP
jgi:tight adherence protein B